MRAGGHGASRSASAAMITANTPVASALAMPSLARSQEGAKDDDDPFAMKQPWRARFRVPSAGRDQRLPRGVRQAVGIMRGAKEPRGRDPIERKSARPRAA
jgi:hypothetical protein